MNWLKDRLTHKGKLIIVILALVILVGAGWSAFRFYDFTQNNPKFCASCHLMNHAYKNYSTSVHKGLSCHACHHATVKEMNKLLIDSLVFRVKTIPPLHDKIIVPSAKCLKCHWYDDKKYPEAKKINTSQFHAKHYFMDKTPCLRCHGYKLGDKVHQFLPSAQFCVKCHKSKKVHGIMGKLACLNCHTDRHANLLPQRGKCLVCHGNKKTREKVLDGNTIDIQFFKPDKNEISMAPKIDVPEGAPMQFDCYTCHKPHTKLMPGSTKCLSCHNQILGVGKHKLHVKMLGLSCTKCHKPHAWRVTKKQAKTTCTQCHGYKKPSSFISG